jgi:GNAT superfamily N-acetyltransferase
MLTTAANIRHRLTDGLTAPDAAGVREVHVAERRGRLVGVGKLTADPAFSGTVSTLVAVVQDARGAGIGAALAGRILAALDRLRGFQTATCALRDDLDRGLAFAQRRGYAQVGHSVGWHLDLPEDDADLVARAADAAAAARVRVRVADVHGERALIVACTSRSVEGLPLDGRRLDLAQVERLIPDDALVLLAERVDAAGAVATLGVTMLTPPLDDAARPWNAYFTGVEPAHRGEGIATALKAGSLPVVRQAGGRSLTTQNADSNGPILELNRRLGMQPGVGFWNLARPLGATAPRGR